MNDFNNIDDKFTHLCFQENWSHIRHLETQRMTVFSALVAFFAVAIYNAEKFINEAASKSSNAPIQAATALFIVSICVSIVALLLTIKWNKTFDKHMSKIENIISYYNKNRAKQCKNTVDYNDFLQYTIHKNESLTDKMTGMPRTGNLFVTAYLLVMSFFLFRLVQLQSKYFSNIFSNLKAYFAQSSFKDILFAIVILITFVLLIIVIRLFLYYLIKVIKFSYFKLSFAMNKMESSLKNKKKTGKKDVAK